MTDSVQEPDRDPADDAALPARRRHHRIQELFLRARALAAEPRAAFLDGACGDDAALRRELELLLRHDQEPLAFVEEGLGHGGDGAQHALRAEISNLRAERAPGDGASRAEAPADPQVIGGYRIRRKLGEGGMGAVFEAEQDQPRRTVALKVLRPLLLSPEGLRRFERESEYLGRLQHPGIAQVYQSGRFESADGPLPYFALEFIRGTSLTEYARHERLDLRARLELVARVADAVEHAHQNGVIHRDLKPQNILVDATGQPKVLDFGIARASDSDVQLTTRHTEVGQILGTLAYMSPEQAAGDSGAIDTRSDVYALGMILYELLAERLPYDLAKKSLPEALRTIQENDPQRLSTVQRVFRGDIETIVGTALEKNKERRYASAAALAADLRHYLRDEPITARPPSRIYVLRKFARRNKIAVGATTAVLLALVGGLMAALRFGQAEAAQRRTAETGRDQVLKLSALQDLEDLLSEADALWPAEPEKIEAYGRWLERARALAALLPELRASREALRAKALPRTEQERQEQRARHPEFAELQRVEGEIAWRTRLLRVRRDGLEVALPTPDASALALDAAGLRAAAWEKVGPLRPRRGDEALGLALAELAFERAPEDQKAGAGETLAWASLGVGRDDEALEASYGASEAASPGLEQHFAQALARMEEEVEKVSSPAWASTTEAELAGLEPRCAELEARVDARTDWHFPEQDGEARWWNNQLTKLIEGLESLETGALAAEGTAITPECGWSVPRRLAWAEATRAAFAEEGEYGRRWAADLDAIHAAYPGLHLAPQLGLVPLGPDPASSLWEFAHPMSGRVPERGAEGRLVLSDETSLVFVLLPGGVFFMGAQALDPQRPNHDPGALDMESPVHEVALRPFFLSKYEMTQGQWLRFVGVNPSYSEDGSPTALQAPVDRVSWTDCMRVLARMGLTLPTESQWEYAVRAGTTTPWWCGSERESLQGAANLWDQTAARAITDWRPLEPGFTLDDGFVGSAPQGTVAANPFGLHEMLGNVGEWCLNPPAYYDGRDGTGPGGASGARLFRNTRGGSFAEDSLSVRSAKRESSPPDFADYRLGVRPARALEE